MATTIRGVDNFDTAPAGLGKVLQVVQGYTTTEHASTSTSDVDSGLSATITPSSTSSKILVCISQHVFVETDNGVGLKIYRNGSALYNAGNYVLFSQYGGIVMNHAIVEYLDSPNTTSAITYGTYFRSRDSGERVGTQYASTNTSTITLMEIAQ